jgi:hypothetical protein
MQFRRSGQRDERRRRALIEETTGDSAQAAPRPLSSVDQDGYSAAALRENQPRLTDLIPLRLRTWLLLVLLAGFAVYGLHWASMQGSLVGPEEANRLALEGPGTLAAWFSSALLLVAAAGSGMVYMLRRHKVDDYRGYYRFWGWLAAWCVLVSLETATGIHQSLESAITTLPIAISAEEFHWGWLIAISLGGLFLGTRMTIEVRDSYWTNCFWIPTVAAYAVVMLLQFEIAWVQSVLAAPLTSGMLLLIGHVTLAGTIWMEARQVFREAQGMVASKEVKVKQVTEPVEKVVERAVVEEETAIEMVPVEDEYELLEEVDEPVAADDDYDENGEELDQQARRIRDKQSRAERKRARRQRRKERRRQAA